MTAISAASRNLRQMRIISIPLTRPFPKGVVGTAVRTPIEHARLNRTLNYYQFQIASEDKAGEKAVDEEKGVLSKWLSRWLPEEGVAKWASTKAADTWAGMGKSKEGSVKLRIYQAGEKLVDRLEFEELALKSIEPSLGPTIMKPDIRGKECINVEKVTIPLIYPPKIATGPTSLALLRTLVDERTPRHKRGFIVWAIIAPFTAPFMIVPVIPNLPFFFCVWRSWSHYRAYRASQYLQSLVDSGAIVPEPSESLDKIYEEHQPRKVEHPDDKSPSSHKHEVLLRREAIPGIIAAFSLKETAAADLYRAVEQARVRVESGRGVL